MTTVLIVGIGNMGAALARGIAKKNKYDLHLFDTHTSRVKDIANELGVTAHITLPTQQKFEIVILCIKPQDLLEVGTWVTKCLTETSLVISILAGQSIAGVRKASSHAGGVVRAMPNIAATVHQAATAISLCEKCSEKHHQSARDIFSCIGTVVEVKEYLLDAVTGLSGSGPAYIFMIIEALIDGGVKMGLTRGVSHELVVQTLLGAATMVKTSNIHPAILKDQVTTPGGTTIHAIHALESKGLRSILIDAVQTATEQSKALRKD